MELGKLSTTLSEALGVNSSVGGSVGGGSVSNLDIYVQATGSSNTKTDFNPATLTQVPLAVKSFESGNLFSIDNGGIKVSEPGIYRVSASAYLYTTGNSTARGLYVMKGSAFGSATEVVAYFGMKPTGEEYAAMNTAPRLIDLSAGDILFLAVRYMGGAGGYYAGNTSTYLLVERLGYVDPGDNVTITQNPSTMVLTIE
jgi:hypothetical protein